MGDSACATNLGDEIGALPVPNGRAVPHLKGSPWFGIKRRTNRVSVPGTHAGREVDRRMAFSALKASSFRNPSFVTRAGSRMARFNWDAPRCINSWGSGERGIKCGVNATNKICLKIRRGSCGITCVCSARDCLVPSALGHVSRTLYSRGKIVALRGTGFHVCFLFFVGGGR